MAKCHKRVQSRPEADVLLHAIVLHCGSRTLCQQTHLTNRMHNSVDTAMHRTRTPILRRRARYTSLKGISYCGAGLLPGLSRGPARLCKCTLGGRCAASSAKMPHHSPDLRTASPSHFQLKRLFIFIRVASAIERSHHGQESQKLGCIAIVPHVLACDRTGKAAEVDAPATGTLGN